MLTSIRNACYRGAQWTEPELWYQFPILRSLFPKASGFTRAKALLDDTHATLRKLVTMHEQKPWEEYEAEALRVHGNTPVRFTYTLHIHYSPMKCSL